MKWHDKALFRDIDTLLEQEPTHDDKEKAFNNLLVFFKESENEVFKYCFCVYIPIIGYTNDNGDRGRRKSITRNQSDYERFRI